MLHKWNHIMCTFGDFFFPHSIIALRPIRLLLESIVYSFYCWIMFLCMDVSEFIQSFKIEVLRTIKKAECRRIDAFELWCWRLLRVPWTARRSNQSILKEINPEYSLERLTLKLKFQYLGHLMQRIDSLEKTLLLGKMEGRRRRGRQRMRWLDGITN